MIYLKIAWRAIKRARLSNLLTMMQLAAALLITAVMVSTVCLRFRKYTPFRDYFGSTGFLVSYAGIAQYGEQGAGNLIEFLADGDALSAHLSAPAEVIAPMHPGFWMSAETKHEKNPQLSAYTDDVLRRWTPQLAAGRWLKAGGASEELEAVVSWNDDEWQVGDSVPITWYINDPATGGIASCGESSVRIVGMLADGEDIAGQTGENREDFRAFWKPHSYDREADVQMLFSASQLEQQAGSPEYLPFLGGTMLVRYTEEVSEEGIKADMQNLSRHSALLVRNMEEIRANSRAYLYSEVYKLLPIIVMLMILVTVSSISSTAISTRKRLRDYAVFSLNGLLWSRCIVINLMQSLLTAAGAVMLAILCGIMIGRTALRDAFYLHWNGWLVLAAAGLILLYLSVSLLMPYLMLRRNSVREILKSN